MLLTGLTSAFEAHNKEGTMSTSREDPMDGRSLEELRIVVVDDNPEYRHLLKRLIESGPTNVVVGEAADGEEAISLVNELHPDVVVMDSMTPVLRNVCSRRGWLFSQEDPVDKSTAQHGAS